MNLTRSRRKHYTPKQWIRSGKRLVRLENLHEQNSPSKFTCSFDFHRSRRTSILDLPDECLIMIFDNFIQEPHLLCRIMKVCRRFYELSFNRRLWRIADFRHNYKSYMHNKFREVNVNRKIKFANFLISKKAIFSHLRVHCNIYEEIGMLRSLIDTCCTGDLRYFEIRWAFFERVLLGKRLAANIDLLREVLQKLSFQSQFIYFFKSQMDGSCLSAKIVGTMTNIQHLELIFVNFLQQEKGTNAIEILLSSLKKLKKLKFKLRQNLDEEFQGYTVQSDSLEYLDYSWSKGFDIKLIDLPRLHTYIALDTFGHNQ